MRTPLDRARSRLATAQIAIERALERAVDQGADVCIAREYADGALLLVAAASADLDEHERRGR